MFLGIRKREGEGTSQRYDGRNQLDDMGERGPSYGQRGSSLQGPNKEGPFGTQEGRRDFFSNSQVTDRSGSGYFKSPQNGGGGPQTEQPRMSLGHQREDDYNRGGRDSYLDRGATSSSMGLRDGRGSYFQGGLRSEFMDSQRSQDFSQDRGSSLTSERERTFAGSGFQYGNGPSREDRSRGGSASYMDQQRRPITSFMNPRGGDTGSILGRGDYSLSSSQDRVSNNSYWERNRSGGSGLFMDQRRGSDGSFGGPQRGDSSSFVGQQRQGNSFNLEGSRDSKPDYGGPRRGDNTSYMNRFGGSSAPSMDRDQGGSNQYRDTAYMNQSRGGDSNYDRVGNSSYNQRGGGNSDYNQRGGGYSNYDQRGGGNLNYDQRGSGNSNYDQQGGGNSNYDQRGGGSSNYDQRGSGNSNYDQRGGGSSNYDQRGGGNSNYEKRGGNSNYDQQYGGNSNYDQQRGGNSNYDRGGGNTSSSARQGGGIPPYSDRQGGGNPPYSDRQGGGNPPYSDHQGRGNSQYLDRQGGGNLPNSDRQGGGNLPYSDRQGGGNRPYPDRQNNTSSVYPERRGDAPYADSHRGQGKPGWSDDLVSKRPGMGRDGAGFGGRANNSLPPQQNRNIQNNPPNNNQTRGGSGGWSEPPRTQNYTRTSNEKNPSPYTKSDKGINMSSGGPRVSEGGWNANMRNMDQQGKFNNYHQRPLPYGSQDNDASSKKRPMDFTSGPPDSKKPRTSVMFRLGAKVGPPATPEGNLPVKKAVQGSDAFEMTRLTPNEIKTLAEKNKNFPIKGLYCHMCDHHKFSSVTDFFTHWNTIKHMDRRRSLLLKINAAYKYLLSDAQYAFGMKLGKFDPDNNQEELCAVCEVPKDRGMKLKDHKVISECWVLHQYVNPRGCCSIREFTSRLLYENHRLSLDHLMREHEFKKKREERYKVEEEKVEKFKELFKKGYTDTDENGKKIITRLQNDSLGKEVRLFQNFGEHEVPKEVLMLLKSVETKTEMPFTGRVLDNPNKFQMRYYEPSVMHGGNHVIFETNFDCILCGVRLERSKQSIIDHCSTKLHYDNILKKQEKVGKVGGGPLKKEEGKKEIKKEEEEEEEKKKKGVASRMITLKEQKKMEVPKPTASRSKWSRGENGEEDEDDDDYKDNKPFVKKEIEENVVKHAKVVAGVKRDDQHHDSKSKTTITYEDPKKEVGGDNEDDYDGLDCEIDEYEFEPDFEV